MCQVRGALRIQHSSLIQGAPDYTPSLCQCRPGIGPFHPLQPWGNPGLALDVEGAAEMFVGEDLPSQGGALLPLQLGVSLGAPLPQRHSSAGRLD